MDPSASRLSLPLAVFPWLSFLFYSLHIYLAEIVSPCVFSISAS